MYASLRKCIRPWEGKSVLESVYLLSRDAVPAVSTAYQETTRLGAPRSLSPQPRPLPTVVRRLTAFIGELSDAPSIAQGRSGPVRTG